MEEFERFRDRIRSERRHVFQWMSRSLDLSPRFMVPEEGNRDRIGRDGASTFGLESLRRVLERDLTRTSK